MSHKPYEPLPAQRALIQEINEATGVIVNIAEDPDYPTDVWITWEGDVSPGETILQITQKHLRMMLPNASWTEYHPGKCRMQIF